MKKNILSMVAAMLGLAGGMEPPAGRREPPPVPPAAREKAKAKAKPLPTPRNKRRECLHPDCKTKHEHNNAYCSAKCCKSHRAMQRGAS